MKIWMKCIWTSSRSERLQKTDFEELQKKRCKLSWKKIEHYCFFSHNMWTFCNFGRLVHWAFCSIRRFVIGRFVLGVLYPLRFFSFSDLPNKSANQYVSKFFLYVISYYFTFHTKLYVINLTSLDNSPWAQNFGYRD